MTRIALFLLGFLLVSPLAPAAATQAYGDGWAVTSEGSYNGPGITRCRIEGNETFVRTAGGAAFSIERLRIIKGRQDIDNLVSAKRFVRIRQASNPGVAGASRVAWCKVRWVNGVRRAVATTRGGARWALIRPYVHRYYMWWACTSGKSGCPSSPPL
jgi:hypothetical protein